MATQVYTSGKYTLFKDGWTSRINQIRLYTNTNTLVNTQSVTFAYNSGDQSIRPSANIVFNVAGGTNNVAYVIIGRETGGIFTEYYSKDLPELYSFSTAGTLTIDSFILTLSSSFLLTQGKADLWQSGWESKITTAKLYTSGDALVDTNDIAFTANVSTGAFPMTGTEVFDVAGGTNNVNYITLGYNDGTDKVLYKRTFISNYNFPTAGTLTVSSWSITVA